MNMLELVMVWSIYMGGCMLLEDMDIDIGLIVWKFMILTITHGLCLQLKLDGKVALNGAGLVKKLVAS